MRKVVLRTSVATVALLALPLTAFAQMPLKEPQPAIILSMTESLIATAAMVRARTGDQAPIKQMRWSATYADQSWIVSLEGEDGPLHVTMTGFLWGNADTGWTVNYAGVGQLQDEQVRDYGRTVWRDGQPSAAPYEFEQVMEFGSHSLWGWMIGAEIVVGGTAGAIGGAATPVTAVFGAVTGASSMIGVSNVVLTQLVNAPKPAVQPAPPARPEPPQINDKLVADSGRTYIFVQKDAVDAVGPRQQDEDFYVLHGSLAGGSASGEISLH